MNIEFNVRAELFAADNMTVLGAVRFTNLLAFRLGKIFELWAKSPIAEVWYRIVHHRPDLPLDCFLALIH